MLHSIYYSSIPSLPIPKNYQKECSPSVYHPLICHSYLCDKEQKCGHACIENHFEQKYMQISLQLVSQCWQRNPLQVARDILHIAIQGCNLHTLAIYRPDSFVLMLRYCANSKATRYDSTRLNRIVADKSHHVRIQLHDAIYLPDYFVLILRYCANLKAIRYESTSLNRIVADKSHRVTVA